MRIEAENVELGFTLSLSIIKHIAHAKESSKSAGANMTCTIALNNYSDVQIAVVRRKKIGGPFF